MKRFSRSKVKVMTRLTNLNGGGIHFDGLTSSRGSLVISTSQSHSDTAVILHWHHYQSSVA